MTIQEQIAAKKAELAAAQSESPVNGDKVNLITSQIVQLEGELSQQKQIEQAHEQRVTQAVVGVDEFVGNLDFGGLTLKQIIGGESEYQLLMIGLKKFSQAQADNFSKQIADLQKATNDQKKAADDKEVQLQQQLSATQQQLYQSTLDLQDTQTKRDAAAKELDDAKKEVDRLNSQVDDLRKEIAVGAREAYKVVDTAEEEAQKKALADKIRKERTVYDVQWVDDLKKTTYKAKLALTGEEIEFPWTRKGSYFEIQESEVLPFRQQYATEQQPAQPVPSVDPQPVQNSVEQGGQFPSIPTPEVPPVVHGPSSTEGNPSSPGQAGTQDTAPVSRAEHEELKQRVAALEAARQHVA